MGGEAERGVGHEGCLCAEGRGRRRRREEGKRRREERRREGESVKREGGKRRREGEREDREKRGHRGQGSLGWLLTGHLCSKVRSGH